MSEYTTEEILESIVDAGGSSRLDLSGKDLIEIDLSAPTIQKIFIEKVWRLRHSTDSKCWNSRSNYQLWYSGIKRAAEVRDRACSRGTNASGDPRVALVAVKRGIILSGANLNDTDCTGSLFQGADLEGTRFNRAYMFNANFSGARLWDTQFEHAKLNRAKFNVFQPSPDQTQRTAIQNTNFSWTDFSGAQFENILLMHCKFDKARITWEQFDGQVGEEIDRRWSDAQQSYISLKNNFVSMSQYSDASKAYMREKTMEEKANFPTQIGTTYLKQRRRIWDIQTNAEGVGHLKKQWLSLKSKFLYSESLNFFYYIWWFLPFTSKNVEIPSGRSTTELTIPLKRLQWILLWWNGRATGHGESFAQVGLLGLVVILGFALAYWGGKMLELKSPSSSEHEFIDELLYFRDSLMFSARNTGTIVFNDISPGNTPAKLMSAFQGLLGPVLLASFVYVLSKRIGRGY